MNYKHGIAAILVGTALLFAVLATSMYSHKLKKQNDCLDRGGVAVGLRYEICIDPKVLR